MDLRPKHKCIIALLLLVSFVLLCGCAEVRAQADVTEEAAGSGAAPHIAVKIEGDNISRVMSSMTLREKIGQLFIIRPDTLGGSVQNLTKEGMALYTSYPAGGFCLFARNIADPQQLKSFTSQLHGLGDRFQPILTIDEEGGPVVRIAANSRFDVPRFPAMGKLTAAGDPPEVRRLASFECSKAIGTYLKEYGFDLDFAPVADVNTNPHNTVIGTRAY
ncbi:MAG: glycoside hydrolase family 3 protein, partial [Firmicutes bacterium]|nr:glycoside hydrolase family 3 protein [Bacillota bacterium]